MKQVTTLNIKFDESKFYGFEANEGKGLIFNSGTVYYTLLAKNIANGNDVVQDSTIENAINDLLVNDFRVYEFNTHKELLNWLAK